MSANDRFLSGASAILLVMFVGLASCAISESPGVSGVSGGEAHPSVPGPQVVNWDNPANGVSVESIAAIQDSLAFDVLTPKGLGDPVGIFTADKGVPKDGRFVEFVYDTQFGRVVVLEHPPDLPPDQWIKANESMVIEQPKGTVQADTIRAGEQAFVFSQQDGSRAGVYWLEGGVTEFWLGGPDLDIEQALSLANSL